jgi:hypothetical protein
MSLSKVRPATLGMDTRVAQNRSQAAAESTPPWNPPAG